MSSLHLAAGSEKPAVKEGQARLYSMKYCPFSHRIRLILSFKKIPHDIVNINLKNKPEWYTEVHPDGRVPAFVDTDGSVHVDSGLIANYIEQKYPEPRLTREMTNERDTELINHHGKIVSIFSKCIHNNDKRPLNEIVEEICRYLVEFEEELINRDTKFFGGDVPGIVDLMIWPWVERAKSLPIIYKETLDYEKFKFPRIMDWIAEMHRQPCVQENACPYQEFAKHIEAMNAGSTDIDNL